MQSMLIGQIDSWRRFVPGYIGAQISATNTHVSVMDIGPSLGNAVACFILCFLKYTRFYL
ncbi:hypothetical protein SAMN05421881_10656 [Nitrosomonas halophila]|uniref:Uncharacterized protein n=1 Tax=Nitrosomonas halophila TaxID=44576 RepID=A0A1H3MVC7_9PROT|nr:hypothetical protein SAMN05421881_10656 [Nitrosomonas halophila]